MTYFRERILDGRLPAGTRLPKTCSSAFVVLSNKEKSARAGLGRQRTPPQCVRDDFLGKHPSMPFCIGFLVDQHNG
jgi:hypothetical protein